MFSDAKAELGRRRSNTTDNSLQVEDKTEKIPRRPRSKSILSDKSPPKTLTIIKTEEPREELVSPAVLDTTLKIGSRHSFAYFRRKDVSPKLQRYLLYSLSKFADSQPRNSALPSSTLGTKQSGLAKIASIIKSSSKKLSKVGLLHELFVNVHDQKSEIACSLVNQLNVSQISKSKSCLNRIFLLAMVNRMDSVCISLLQKGFPNDICSSISGTSTSIMPSYFILAIALDCRNLIETMLELKPNLEASWNGVTPLLLAVLRNDHELVETLLQEGANPDASMSYENYHYLHNFKQAGSTSNQVSPRRKSVHRTIFSAEKVIYLFEYAIASSEFKIAAILLYHTKPSILSLSSYCFITCSDEQINLLLLKLKANTNQRDELGFTPLHLAVRQNNLHLVSAFFHAKADINAKSKDGSTAVHLALSVPNLKILQYLVLRGADLSLTDSSGKTAIDRAKLQLMGDVTLVFGKRCINLAPMKADEAQEIDDLVSQKIANATWLTSPLPQIPGGASRKTEPLKKSASTVDKKSGFLSAFLGRKSTTKGKRSPSE